MKRLFFVIITVLYPCLSNAQVLEIYRKYIGPESYPTSDVERLSVHSEGNEAYHEICQDGFNERLYINDIDSIVCLSEEAMHESSTSVSLDTYLRQCMNDESSRFQVFSKLVAATGLVDKFALMGYTLFAEPDVFWERAIGKDHSSITVEDVKQYLMQQGSYQEALTEGDYTKPEHLLFLFVSYHIVPVKLNPYRLVLHANEYGYDIQRPGKLATPVIEYYPTLDSCRPLKIYESAESGGVFLNRFPMLDNGRTGTGHEKSCPKENIGLCIQREKAEGYANGFIYPIDGLLLYDEATRINLSKERIRFDAASLLPELMNNDARRKCSTAEKDQTVTITPASNQDNLTINEETTLVYSNSYRNERSYYQGDVLRCSGIYDITLRLPSVPVSGNYQLRMGSVLTTNGTICQAYWGEDKSLRPQGIPIDWRQNDNNIGWEDDTDDEVYDAQIDRSVMNRGWVKAPRSISSPGYDSARRNPKCMRKILVQGKMQTGSTYYLRLKCVSPFQGELLLDYFELVPEAIYAQSDVEDIW